MRRVDEWREKVGMLRLTRRAFLEGPNYRYFDIITRLSWLSEWNMDGMLWIEISVNRYLGEVENHQPIRWMNRVNDMRVTKHGTRRDDVIIGWGSSPAQSAQDSSLALSDLYWFVKQINQANKLKTTQIEQSVTLAHSFWWDSQWCSLINNDTSHCNEYICKNLIIYLTWIVFPPRVSGIWSIWTWFEQPSIWYLIYLVSEPKFVVPTWGIWYLVHLLIHFQQFNIC